MNNHFELTQTEYAIVHRASNACRTKYGIHRVEPVTIAVLALDFVKTLNLLDLPRRLHRAAMHVKGLTQMAAGEETKQPEYGSIVIPTDIVADMARVWYAQVELSEALSLRQLVLMYFHLWSEEMSLQRMHQGRTARRRLRAFADAGVYSDAAWSGESVVGSGF